MKLLLQNFTPQSKRLRGNFLWIKLLLCFVIINIILISACARKQVGTIEKIKLVLNNQVEAWNKGELEGYMNGYWNSPELVFFSDGDKTMGWEPVYKRYKSRYQDEGKEMGKLEFSEVEVEMLSSNSAFVKGRWKLKISAKDFDGLFTLIFKKFPEGWKIIHDHTSVR
jgi:beta-aspartyl-peptidase (threonine type)